MNFSQLQSFVALAETGSFTEAAYSVHMTQSAVSHSLASLEGELGITLIERNRKGVVALTRAGQKIIPHVRALLTHGEAIEQEAKIARGLAMGKLRLGSISAICPGLLAGVLTHFQQQYPDIEVVLFEGTIQEVREWIDTSIVDVGFVFHPAQGIDSTPITTDEVYVYVAKEHPLHRQAVVSLQDLRKERWIMPRSGCEFMVMAGFKPEESKGALIRYQASDSSTILAMIREGLGITLLPRMVLPEKLDGVVPVPLDPPLRLQIGLAVQSQATASPGAKLLIQAALAWVQEHASFPAPAPITAGKKD